MNRDQRVIWDLTGEVQRLRELLLDARDMIRAGIDDYDGVQEDALVGRIEAALAGAAVQPEGCCLDYPRCDCNSPPEPDNEWHCSQYPDCECFAGCREKALEVPL